MIGSQLDIFARQLARTLPRRPAIGVLTGLLSIGLTRPQPALACKKVGKKCDKNKDCCDGARCKGGKNSKCKCKNGFTKCDKKCYDLDKDEKRCGSCNTACAPGATCQNGACVEGGYAFVTQWGRPGTAEGELNGPRGLALSADGAVYIADSGGDRVQVFSDDGDFLDTWGTTGSGDGQFNLPYGLAVDPDGNVYVSDRTDNRVQKFDGDGTYLDEWGGFGSGDGQFRDPYGVAASVSGEIFVADPDNARIQKFDSDSTHLLSFGTGHLAFPFYAAVASDGTVYVTDTFDRIQKFAPDGTYLLTIGESGDGDGQLDTPFGVAVDADGNVIVADFGNDRVQKFAPNGTFLSKWGNQGSGIGEFEGPWAVAIDGQGNVYVSEVGNGRIQKFAPA
jgi:DNA-binding beta-propeller fold protein YncE